MKTYQNLLFLIIVAISFSSCKKTNNDLVIGDKLEFYLLDEYETIENKPEIIKSTAVISTDYLISYDDIISYNSSTYTFSISGSIISKMIEPNGIDYHTKAFAVTIDKEIIYSGYFWYATSSSICDWITIDPILSGENALKVNLAYPSNSFASSKNDPRNDQRIIQLLKKDGKLID